jgi:polar amino acid transport system permease protein
MNPPTLDTTRVDSTTKLPTQIVPLRHPGRILAAVIVLIAAASLGYSAVTNANFE